MNPSHAVPEGGPAAPAPRPQPRLLVIDDERGFRELMGYELGGRGYLVETAADGDEAVRKARLGAFDVAVSDLTMPKRDGLATLAALKAIDPGLEVIMVTGYATLESAVESMKRGAYDFITKPFQIPDLARILERAVEKRRLSRKIDELREINRFKSEFLANMSHELRTPMNAILGYTSLHLDGLYGEVSSKQAESLRRVENAGRNLLQLINSVLDLSKVSAGRMPVYLEDFAVAELVQEVAAMLEGLAKAKGLELRWSVEPGLRMRSDKTKLKQMLVNLASNAIKFTPRGGVSVAARAPEEGEVRFEVQDTGIGIREADLGQLFQEFRQLDASATREYGGTGLGLAITKRFAELLGGTVAVESKLGEGSTFTVRLPFQGSPSLLPPPEFSAPAPDSGSRTVLAIDDDPEVLALLRDSLRGSSYAFTGAQSPDEGLALARRIKPFAITLDLMMPHRDGWSVLQALKNDPELRAIPVIMVSILDNKALGFALGVSEYIVKPFERPELLEKLAGVERSLRRHEPAEPRRERAVLVVDDEPGVAELLSLTLRKEGYAVEAVTGGREAIDRLRGGAPPDILFLDLIMPGVTGFDVLDAIEAEPSLSRIVIVALSAKSLTAQEARHLRQRVEVVIQKGSKTVPEVLRLVRGKLESLEVG